MRKIVSEWFRKRKSATNVARKLMCMLSKILSEFLAKL